jgi:RNA recognition motif-containing protein
MTRTKVFVGNLSFKTKREDLASEFGAAGKVVEANIITRGTRSLGYGFVEMESEEDANKAISIMNKKPIDSREINVELAKPRDESKVSERRSGPSSSSSQGGNGGGAGGAGGDAGGANRRPRRRFRRGGSNASPTTGRNNNNNNEGGSQNNNSGGGNNNNNSRRDNNRDKRAGDSNKEGGRNSSPSAGGGADGGDKGTPGNRRFRNRRFRRSRFPRKDLPQRKETETSLFVANLPFSVDNQALSDLYKAYNVKSAHVVVNRNGKSKGFGFVELATQADQKAALDATNKSKVEGRELIVKIALTPIEEHKDSSQSSQPEASSNEPATKEEPKK